jgi:glycosyltransferase involved in cell wall biosynthesis
MAWCYRRAALFVMTSRVEACPNTVLEAMANGALSISTTSPPMPEFFAHTASYYPAGDADALAKSAARLLTLSAVEVGELRQAARRRAGTFDWQLTAERTVAELAQALDSSPEEGV